MIPEHATLAQYFAMGGYWPFIWPSYGLGVAALAVLCWISVRRLGAAERALGSDARDSDARDSDARDSDARDSDARDGDEKTQFGEDAARARRK